MSSSTLTVAGKRFITVLRWSRRPSTRGFFLTLSLLATLTVIFTPTPAILFIWKATLTATLALIVWPFVQGPYLLYTRHSVLPVAGFKVVEPAQLADFPQHHLSALENLGFTFVGVLERAKDNPLVRTRVALFLHFQNEDTAQLGRVESSLRAREVLVFGTRFGDGLVLETSNSHTPPISRPKPQFPGFRFSAIRDTGDLYLVHQKLREQFSQTRRPLATDPVTALPLYISTAETIHQLNLSQGDYKPDRSGDRYVLTLRGAIRRSWLHRVSFFREMSGQRAAYRKCRELGFGINPKFGRIYPLPPS